MFADTDFILALIKDSDWLKEKATRILNENNGDISTSVSVMIEIALIFKRLNINALDSFANIFELIKMSEEDYAVSIRAALYIEKYKLNVFDAFHAAYCGDEKIISSDKVYGKVGLERVKLER